MDTKKHYLKKNQSYYQGFRSELLNFIKPGNSVIEFGCGSGGFLEGLKKYRKFTKTVGVELFDDAFNKAKTSSYIDRIYQYDLNTYKPLTEKFDAIICFDVIEHLFDDNRFLQSIADNAHEQSQFYFSVPNVSSLKVVLPLLFLNAWSYKDSGILDSTHIRFYTKKSFTSLLIKNNYYIFKIKPIFHSNFVKFLNCFTFGFFSRFLATQFFFHAGRK